MSVLIQKGYASLSDNSGQTVNALATFTWNTVNAIRGLTFTNATTITVPKTATYRIFLSVPVVAGTSGVSVNLFNGVTNTALTSGTIIPKGATAATMFLLPLSAGNQLSVINSNAVSSITLQNTSAGDIQFISASFSVEEV
jgi:hypothetical protein